MNKLRFCFEYSLKLLALFAAIYIFFAGMKALPATMAVFIGQTLPTIEGRRRG